MSSWYEKLNAKSNMEKLNDYSKERRGKARQVHLVAYQIQWAIVNWNPTSWGGEASWLESWAPCFWYMELISGSSRFDQFINRQQGAHWSRSSPFTSLLRLV
jgi:hypothetical protein